jgi:urease accessory protein UreE
LQQNFCIPWINRSCFASSTSRLTYDEKRLRRVNCESQTDRQTGIFVSRTEHMAGGGLLGRWSRR